MALSLTPLLAFGAHPDDIEFGCGGVNKIAHTVLFTAGDDEILRFILLQDQPLGLDKVAGMPPVATGIEIAEDVVMSNGSINALAASLASLPAG